MISEVDIRDWDIVDFSLVEKAQDPETSLAVSYKYLVEFSDQVERLKYRQLSSKEKQTPALFKPLIAAVNRGE